MPKERKENMNFSKVGRSSLFTCIVEIVVGILLLVNPVGFTSGILIAFGVVMAIMGVIKIVRYFLTDAEEAAHEGNLSTGLLLALIGFICVLKKEWILATFPMITLIYGIVNLISGISKLQKSVDMIRLKRRFWYVALISAVMTLIFAFFIIANPFATTAILWIFIGVTLIVEAVVDLVTFIFFKKS